MHPNDKKKSIYNLLQITKKIPQQNFKSLRNLFQTTIPKFSNKLTHVPAHGARNHSLGFEQQWRAGPLGPERHLHVLLPPDLGSRDSPGEASHDHRREPQIGTLVPPPWVKTRFHPKLDPKPSRGPPLRSELLHGRGAGLWTPHQKGFCEGFWFVADEMRSARGKETSPETWGGGE